MLAPIQWSHGPTTEHTISVPTEGDRQVVLFAPPEQLGRGRLDHGSGPVRVLVVEGWTGDYQLLVEHLRDARIPVELTRIDRAETAMDLLCGDNAFEHHILLIDPILPGTDGWEVLEALREQGCGGDLAIVVQAAMSSDFVIRRCRDLGVEALVEKPMMADGFHLLLDALGFAHRRSPAS